MWINRTHAIHTTQYKYMYTCVTLHNPFILLISQFLRGCYFSFIIFASSDKKLKKLWDKSWNEYSLMLLLSKSTSPKNNRIWGGWGRSWKALEKLREIMQIDENFLFDFNSRPDIPLLTWLKGLQTTLSFFCKIFPSFVSKWNCLSEKFWCHLYRALSRNKIECF